MVAEWPSTTYGWGGLAFIVVICSARIAYWITDRRRRKHKRIVYRMGEHDGTSFIVGEIVDDRTEWRKP